MHVTAGTAGRLTSGTESDLVCAAKQVGEALVVTERKITKFVASRAQQEAYNTHMVKAIITANLPFSFIENEHVIAAAAEVGCTLPSRKQLAGPVLEATGRARALRAQQGRSMALLSTHQPGLVQTAQLLCNSPTDPTRSSGLLCVS